MTLQELIDELVAIRDEAADELGDKEARETKLSAAYQPTYPLAGNITAVTLDFCEAAPRVWLAVSNADYNESPYAPKHAWDGDVIYPDEQEA